MKKETYYQALLLCNHYEHGWTRRCTPWELESVYPTIQGYHASNINFFFASGLVI
jgi:hypothetical protein